MWASVEASLSDHAQFQAIEIEGELPVIGRRTFVLDAYRLAGDRNALILLTFHDVTERKQAERTTSLFAAIVDTSRRCHLSKKLDGTITSWNQSAERLFGYTPEEAIGQHITLIVPWERRSEEEGILRRLAQGERVDHFETVRRRKNGTTLDLSLTISPIHDAAGRVIGASNVARDITERKRIEQALQKSEKKYREFAETATIALHWVSWTARSSGQIRRSWKCSAIPARNTSATTSRNFTSMLRYSAKTFLTGFSAGKELWSMRLACGQRTDPSGR